MKDQKILMDNIILKDAILETIDKLKGINEYEMYIELKEILEKTYD